MAIVDPHMLIQQALDFYNAEKDSKTLRRAHLAKSFIDFLDNLYPGGDTRPQSTSVKELRELLSLCSKRANL